MSVEMTKPKIVSRGRVVWASFLTGWTITLVVLFTIAIALSSPTIATVAVWVMFAPVFVILAGMIILIVFTAFAELWRWAFEDPTPKDDET